MGKKYLDYDGLTRLKTKLDESFVPYTGASKNVNLGNHSFQANEVVVSGASYTSYYGPTSINIMATNVDALLRFPTFTSDEDETIATREWTTNYLKGYVTIGELVVRNTSINNGPFIEINAEGHCLIIGDNFDSDETFAIFPRTGNDETVAYQSWVLAQGFKTSDLNHYPKRSYTSGLKISTYEGSSYCELYVPYSSASQVGVVKLVAGQNVSVAYSNGEATISSSGTMPSPDNLTGVFNLNTTVQSAMNSGAIFKRWRVSDSNSARTGFPSDDGYGNGIYGYCTIEYFVSAYNTSGFPSVVRLLMITSWGVYFGYKETNNNILWNRVKSQNSLFEHLISFVDYGSSSCIKFTLLDDRSAGYYPIAGSVSTLAQALVEFGYDSEDNALPASGTYDGDSSVCGVFGGIRSGSYTLSVVYGLNNSAYIAGTFTEKIRDMKPSR